MIETETGGDQIEEHVGGTYKFHFISKSSQVFLSGHTQDCYNDTQLRFERLSWVHTETSVWGEQIFSWGRFDLVETAEASSIVCYDSTSRPI